ncbi:unnamed protein product [Dovyalis caffra]|uniref:Uncharacterized protein n=1 Tax=Dovyalis caffra TaxID=77055 RepID=A0AAV1R641_9ROSI|nr:unnamed protein product [Dovyalis caffra]CAK7328774.1 unnamed protein product [Dovyalis caffra]
MSAPGFGRPIRFVWLVQLSLLEAPAVVRLHVCRGRLVLLEVCPSGGLFSVFSIQCPHCVRKSSSSISLRNAIKKFFIWGTLDGFLRQQGVERYVFLKQGRAEVSRILTTIFRGLESKQGTREGQEYTEREVKAGAAPIGKP